MSFKIYILGHHCVRQDHLCINNDIFIVANTSLVYTLHAKMPRLGTQKDEFSKYIVTKK